MADPAGIGNSYVRAAVLGAVAGMRTQLPFAALGLAANRGGFAAEAGWPLSLLRSPAVLAGLGASALGELVVDKLPIAPSRLAPGPFVGRVAFGAVVGAAVARAAGESAAVGAVAGALGAVAGAEAGYHARATLGRWTGLPDAVWGAAEDGVAVALALFAVGVPARLAEVGDNPGSR